MQKMKNRVPILEAEELRVASAFRTAATCGLSGVAGTCVVVVQTTGLQQLQGNVRWKIDLETLHD